MICEFVFLPRLPHHCGFGFRKGGSAFFIPSFCPTIRAPCRLRAFDFVTLVPLTPTARPNAHHQNSPHPPNPQNRALRPPTPCSLERSRTLNHSPPKNHRSIPNFYHSMQFTLPFSQCDATLSHVYCAFPEERTEPRRVLVVYPDPRRAIHPIAFPLARFLLSLCTQRLCVQPSFPFL
jgi:hypothetical protein